MRVLNGFVKCDLLAHLLLPLMLCSTIILQAQTIKKATDPLASFTNYNTEQGLALSSVACSFMDSQGNLWFGTYGGGASRFDGKNFVNFNNNNGLSRNTIWNIEEDIYGNIWFGTDGGGISVYDGYEFRTINSKQGLLHDIVWAICSDNKGNVWIGTYGGVSVLALANMTNHDFLSSIAKGKLPFTSYSIDNGLPNNDVRCITEDSFGNIWFGTSSGIAKFSGGNLQALSEKDGLISNSVLCISDDGRGSLWVGTEKGVSVFPIEMSLEDVKQKIRNYTVKDGLVNDKVREILADNKGNIWLGTVGGGVSMFNGKIFTSITTVQGLAHNSIRSITKDNNGNIWFGTVGGGVSRYNGSDFMIYTEAQGLSYSRVFSIIEDRKGNIWFGTMGGGVSKFNGEVFLNYTTMHGLANNSVYGIVEDNQGNIWFGTMGGGVSKFNGKTFINYTVKDGLAHDRAWRLYVDSKDNIWIGTYGGGVSKFDGSKFTNYTVKEGLANNTVESILDDSNGNLWFGTVGGGLSKFDGNSFTTYNTTNGLVHNRVRCIIKDLQGFIWFGTDAGISRFDGETFFNLTTQHGLPNGVVYDMDIDNHGLIWVGTNEGISGLYFQNSRGEKIPAGTLGVNNKTLEKDHIPVWDIYNNKTGYAVKDINTNAMCFTRIGLPYGSSKSKGIVWAGCGDDRVVRFDPSMVAKQTGTMKLQFQQLKVDEEVICWHTLYSLKNKLNNDSARVSQNQVLTYGRPLTSLEVEQLESKFSDISFTSVAQFYPMPINLILPYKHNSVTIEFNAIETERNFMVNYQYMLRGEDDTWRPVTRNTFATFGNLREGSYTFMLRAQSPQGIWTMPIEYSFRVLPPLWRSWWMYIIYTVTMVVSIRMLILWRVKVLENEKKYLEKVVKQRTIDLEREKEEAERQRALVEEKNEEIATQHEQLIIHHKAISDSINYAQWLQMALLPSGKTIDELLVDVFVFYNPKDVVSGDFYWVEKIALPDNSGERVLFAVADCTGHGVPGALISVVCNIALNSAVKEFKLISVDEILFKVNELVIETFERSGRSMHEGMDIALCSIDYTTKELQYAGAGIPLYIYSKSNTKDPIIYLKASPSFIGQRANVHKRFQMEKVCLNSGDIIYITSDGLIDQFGGDDAKKFSVKQFKELILSNVDKPMPVQRDVISDTFYKWKGVLDQIDDVCVMGIKI